LGEKEEFGLRKTFDGKVIAVSPLDAADVGSLVHTLDCFGCGEGFARWRCVGADWDVDGFEGRFCRLLRLMLILQMLMLLVALIVAG
jgi:hypothetical protein